MWKIIKAELRLLKSQKLYILLIIMTILRKTLLNRTRDMDAYAAVDSNNSIAILATIVMLGIVLTKQQRIRREIDKCKPFLYYYLFAAISVIWAGFQYLAVAGYKAVEVIVSFTMVILIMRNLPTIKARFTFVMISFSFCNIIYLIMGVRSGVFHDNAFPLLAITQLLLILGSVRYKFSDWKHMQHHAIVAVATIILGTSSASWISLFIGLFFYLSTNKKGINLGLAIGMGILFYTTYQVFDDSIASIIFKNKTEEQIKNGSGREALWLAYIKGWMESPIIGHGFIVGEKGAIASKYIAFATNTAHNMIISVMINTGLIGLGLWIAFMWKQCRICWQYSLKKNVYALTCFPAIIAMFVNANSFPVIGSEWSPTSPPIYALLIFVFVYIPLSQQPLKNKYNNQNENSIL